jgi:hypothetical protein
MVLGIVLLLAVAAGGYWLGTQKSIPVAKSSQPTPLPTKVVITTPTVDPTAGWKEYKNTRLKYALRYPRNAVLTEIGEPKNDDCVEVRLHFAYITIKSPNGTSGGCIQTGRGAYDKVETITEDVLLGNQNYAVSGNNIDSSTDPDALAAGSELRQFLWLENLLGKGSIIEYGGVFNKAERNQYEQEKQAVRQILATFRFLD